MSTNPQTLNLSVLCRRFTATIRRAPFHFIVLQFPEAVTDIVDAWLMPDASETSNFKVIGVLTFFLIASATSSALTFASVRQCGEGIRPSLLRSGREVGARFWTLLAASLLVGAVCALGITALILPGLYLMAVYLFVPQSLMDDPRLSPMATLNRATKFSRPYLKRCIGFVALIFAASLFAFQLGKAVSGWTAGFAVPDFSKPLLAGLIRMPFSILLGLIVDIFISETYLAIKQTGKTT